jgi:hypothetical protein
VKDREKESTGRMNIITADQITKTTMEMDEETIKVIKGITDVATAAGKQILSVVSQSKKG